MYDDITKSLPHAVQPATPCHRGGIEPSGRSKSDLDVRSGPAFVVDLA